MEEVKAESVLAFQVVVDCWQRKKNTTRDYDYLPNASNGRAMNTSF
jgi:hypothetical protein